jgi:general secretion pathway protein G
VKKRKRRLPVTLIEMIIVMILIATITGALAYNYQQTLDKGRLFATKQKAERLKTILTLYFSEHPDEINRTTDWKHIIEDSGLGPPRADDLLKDDFGGFFLVNVASGNEGEGIVVTITSPAMSRASKS